MPTLDLDYNVATPASTGTNVVTTVALNMGSAQPVTTNNGMTLAANGVAEKAVYHNVATVDGMSIDLVGYVQRAEMLGTDGLPNGRDSNPSLDNTNPAASGGEGTANVSFHGNSIVEVRWVLVQSGTDTPVVVDNVSVLINDLDGVSDLSRYERITVGKDQMDSYVLESDPANPTNIRVTDNGASLTFTPDDDDPGAPGARPDNSVGLSFRNTSEFTIEYEKFNIGGNVGLDGTFSSEFFSAPTVQDTNPDFGTLFTEEGAPVSLSDTMFARVSTDGVGVSELTIQPVASTIEDGASEVIIINGDGGTTVSVALDGSDTSAYSITVDGTVFDIAFSGGSLRITPASGPAADGPMQTLLQGLQYENTSDMTVGLDPTVRQLNMTLTDANGDTTAPATATIQVVGIDNSPPTVNSAPSESAGTAEEAGHEDNGTAAPGVSQTGGVLTANDIDSTGAPIWSGSATGTYGDFSIDAGTGAWTFVLNNDLNVTQSLMEGETVQETFMVSVADSVGNSSQHPVTVTILGTNDVPVITTAPGQDSGAVKEAGIDDLGDPVAGTTVATGQATSTDVDDDATATWTGDTNGIYGSFIIDPDTGRWTYTLDNDRPETQALSQGNHAVETFEITVTDDKGAIAAQTVTVRVDGTADAGSGVIMTEDVWFATNPDAMDFTGDAKTEWQYWGGSGKLELEVELPIAALFGDDTTWTFESVNVTHYIEMFAELGITDLDVIDIDIKDDEITLKFKALGVELTEEEFDALPTNVHTPVMVQNENGNSFCAQINVMIANSEMHSPIAFDLNNDGRIGVTGVSTAQFRVDGTIGDTVLFDLDGDGCLERIEWLNGDGDALLIDNRDGLAVGDMDGNRLFGDQSGMYANGYDKLAILDNNFDGELTGDELNGLQLWVDDGDALLRLGELRTLAELGITSISVTERNVINDVGETLIQSQAVMGTSTAPETPVPTPSTPVADDGDTDDAIAAPLIVVDPDADEEVGTAEADRLFGGKGNDTLVGNEGDDLLGGGADNDDMQGGAGQDSLYGGAGDDTMSGGDGDDRMGGASGDDNMDGGNGNDEIWASSGNDTVLGGDGADTIGGASGDDSIDGGAGDDEIWASSGNDIAFGGDGADTMGGSGGSDTLNGGAGEDELWGSSGNDVLNGDADNDALGGGSGDDIVNGGSGDDGVFGGSGHDVLQGGEGDDGLYGASGNDTLIGGAGTDDLYGGSGADTFVFGAGSDTDTIHFFKASDDRIQLDDDLWLGTLTTDQVVSEFASIIGDDLVITFETGDVLTLADRASLNDLQDYIDII